MSPGSKRCSRRDRPARAGRVRRDEAGRARRRGGRRRDRRAGRRFRQRERDWTCAVLRAVSLLAGSPQAGDAPRARARAGRRRRRRTRVAPSAERGHEVVAIDNSPGAVEVCRRRGVRDARVLDFAAVDESLGVFDTIVMLGNNSGVFGSPAQAKRLLRRLHRSTSEEARILAESRDVSSRGAADAPWHVEYRRRNVEHGRLPGQIRIRSRFRTLVRPWFDYPMVSPDELRAILEGSGWRLAQTIDSDDTYVAVIEKAARAQAARSATRATAGAATSRASGRRLPRSARASSRA
jgi:hypothetical protein